MRSYSGCLTCRTRKLKCDEAKPYCRNCSKSSRDCVFTERAVFRHVEVQAFYSEKLCEDDRVWLNIPKDCLSLHIPAADPDDAYAISTVTFIQIDDPYTFNSPAPECHQHQSTGPLSPAISSQDNPVTTWACPDQEICHESNNDEHDLLVEFVGPAVPASIGDLEFHARENILTLRLLQHFREGPGQWMDVFDTNAYFSNKVPLMAVTKPVLKSAACALAARHIRHLHHVRNEGRRPDLTYQKTGVLSFVDDNIDWQLLSARYYHDAISRLKSAVQMRRFAADGPEREYLFAAIAILCTCDLMESPGKAWRAHLSALPLFVPPSESDSPLSSSPLPRASISGPVFWSLARQDLLCAFVSETPTRLDVNDVQLWKNAGLATDANGLLTSLNSNDAEEIRTTAAVVEDTRSNEIHWLLGKIVNYVTSGDALYPENYALSRQERPPIGVTQEQLLDRWALLVTELQSWRESLPASFTPSARTSVARCDGSTMSSSEAACKFEQIWYEAPICAGAMQSYHMAAILLLVNQPQESTAIRNTVSARLHAYRRGEREALLHAREICGIALSKPPSPVRVHSVQPLSVAGQVFEKWHDVEVVLQLLEEIEKDLGWTTSYYITRLKASQEGWKDERPSWVFL